MTVKLKSYTHSFGIRDVKPQLKTIEFFEKTESFETKIPTTIEDHCSATMLFAKRSAGIAPEVNFKEHVTHTPLLNANKAAHSGFEIQRRRQ